MRFTAVAKFSCSPNTSAVWSHISRSIHIEGEMVGKIVIIATSNFSLTAKEIAALVQELGIKYTLDDRLDTIAT